ncbi:interleukin-15 receptor subunit alpha, partial [Aotus nancymaae]|uniref:interleukin-15 receptor subunit alpha n=1 Tax=Aotus nancymaae TaxID=37293 RepID=UPI0030FE6129
HPGRPLKAERRAPEGDLESRSRAAGGDQRWARSSGSERRGDWRESALRRPRPLSPQCGHRTNCTLGVLEHEERGEPGGSRACVGITCPAPVSVEHADIWVKSYSLHSRERYICNSGFKRKAGTSSLTECVLNKATNIAYWTTPSLKCIRDPALARQRPAPPSTVTTAGVTPQPESFSPSGKEPAASSPSSGTTMATTAALVLGSRLTPSKSPSTGTTGIGSHESSHSPSQTAARTWELTASASHQLPDAYPAGNSSTIVAISTSTVLLCGLSAVSLLACYIKSRQTPRPVSVEMEAMEALPVTRGTSDRDEDSENRTHNL